MTKILSIIVGLLLVISSRLSGCTHPLNQSLPEVHITYSIGRDTITINTAITPYDKDPIARSAYIFGFKRGFEDAMNEKMAFMTWEKSLKGKAGEAGYVAGTQEWAAYNAKKTPSK
jgi:hypothetical protein